MSPNISQGNPKDKNLFDWAIEALIRLRKLEASVTVLKQSLARGAAQASGIAFETLLAEMDEAERRELGDTVEEFENTVEALKHLVRKGSLEPDA